MKERSRSMYEDDELYKLLMMPPHVQQVAITLAEDIAARLKSTEAPPEQHLECYAFVLRELLDTHRKRGGLAAEPVHS